MSAPNVRPVILARLKSPICLIVTRFLTASSVAIAVLGVAVMLSKT